MGRLRILLTATVLAAGGLAALAPMEAGAALTCGQIYEQARSAEAALDGRRMEELYQAALNAPDCNAEFRDGLRSKVAVVLVEQVDRALRSGTPASSVEGQLQRSLRYQRNWQVLAMLGDISRARRDYDVAADRYQQALVAIDDPELTPSPPPATITETVFRKAETTRMLATRYKPAPRNRAGTAVGLADDSVRGFGVESVALPITFDTDSTRFTAEGERAARDLLESLNSQGSPSIVLVGHTDPRGSDDYNQTLSVARAQAVKDYLLRNGYSGRVSVEGRGERQRFRPDDPGAYDEEQRWQMDRRVELKRGG